MKQHPVETALRSGSRAKNFSGKISELVKSLPENVSEMDEAQRAEAMRLASMCRCVRAVADVVTCHDLPEIERAPLFSDLFCEMYYPVMEDGKRTVGFWSFKDNATLAPEDVHEWVRGTKVDKETKKTVPALVSFAQWWKNMRPDYELFGVASDRAEWKNKIIDTGDRRCVNTMYGHSPVLERAPDGYDPQEASDALDVILTRMIAGGKDEERKRRAFVLDVGAHLLALRNGTPFRCRKIFCFASTNGGQGTGKTFLHESIAALVPRDAVCVTPATTLATENLLPLYSSTVCILTEAPPNAAERYTAEDVKAFADAGWKTAQEKYVAKRSVKDNSLKLLSSNHLSPLPIDSPVSRRVEFFEAIETDDGGEALRACLAAVQKRTGWTDDKLRACVGWALLERAERMLAAGAEPFATARRTIDPKFLLSTPDYDYLVKNGGRDTASYSSYRDWRTDKGITWSPDMYRFEATVAMSRREELWIDGGIAPEPTKPLPPAPDGPEDCEDDGGYEECGEPVPRGTEEEAAEEPESGPVSLQYKRRMATARLEDGGMTMAKLYAYIVSDEGLKAATEDVRAGRADKKLVLRQVFPGARFERFTRTANLKSFTGLVHVDFDHVKENGNGLTPEQIRDALAEMPGFVIGALSSRGNGAWGIFNAGEQIKDYRTYLAASKSLFSMCEEKMCMESDHGTRLPTVGRTLAHDPDCRICDEAVMGHLPEPFRWKAATYETANVKLRPYEDRGEISADERLRNERFLEKVVEKACENIQLAGAGQRHDTAIKAIANVTFHCQERGVAPLSAWGRQIRDACRSCGLDGSETNCIMDYWKQRTGVPC